MNERPGRGAGIGLLLGSIIVVVSAFLAWFTLSIAGVGDNEIKGVGNENGGALAMGVGAVAFAVIAGILGLILAIRGRGRGLAIAGLVFSLLMLFVTAYAAFSPEQAIVAFEAGVTGENLGISESEAKAALEEGFESEQLNATAEVGTYVGLAGSAIATIASIAGIVTAGRRRDDTQVVVAPPAATGTVPPPPTGTVPPPPPPPPAGPPAGPPEGPPAP